MLASLKRNLVPLGFWASLFLFGSNITQNTGGGVLAWSNGSTSYSTCPCFFAPGGSAGGGATDAAVNVGAPNAGTISSMYVTNSTAPGTGNSITYTWRKNAASQTLTCTISGSSAKTCNDITHSFSMIQGDLLDIEATTTGVPSTASTAILVEYRTVN